MRFSEPLAERFRIPDRGCKNLVNSSKKGIGDRPDAPALIRYDGRWMILWGERSDRLEVVVENQGAGVWPRKRFKALYGSSWWGPLR